jgi:uncharacterized protein (TIGR02300 family)
VINPEWGTKRICQSCHAKFYDLNREPVLCPKCQTEFDPNAGLKSRGDAFVKKPSGRAKSVFDKVTPLGVAEADPVAAPEDRELDEEEDEAAVVGDDVDEDEEDAIEDASELGDDEDDVAEIIEGVDEEER